MEDGDFRDKRILIAGLGVIGGSVAKSLWKAGCNHIYAYDRDADALRSAQAGGIICAGYTDLNDAYVGTGPVIDKAPLFDIAVCCLPPHLAASCYESTAPHIKSGGVFAEMSGLKMQIMPVLEAALRSDHELLSLHPMAGSEKSGYTYSDTHMFVDCMMILTTSHKTGAAARQWADALFHAMRCREMRTLSPAQHDDVIARVSHIPHIAALAVKAIAAGDERYAGGSYNAVTRVADINAPLWAGLLTDNREYLKESIMQLKKQISILEDAIGAGDADALEKLLEMISNRTADIK